MDLLEERVGNMNKKSEMHARDYYWVLNVNGRENKKKKIWIFWYKYLVPATYLDLGHQIYYFRCMKMSYSWVNENDFPEKT